MASFIIHGGLTPVSGIADIIFARYWCIYISYIANQSFLKTFMEYEFGIEIWCKCKSYMPLHMECSVEFI
jgi:hypothetical protein